jgi:hypothetical protein
VARLVSENEKPRSLLVAENVTLWTLLATVSLFTAGNIAHAYQFGALGLRGVHTEAQWQDRVFEGGIGVLNMLLKAITEPSLQHIPWLATLVLFIVALVLRKRVTTPRRKILLAIVAGIAYLATLIFLSASWGNILAQFVRDRPRGEHYVFSADSAPRLPPALLHDNEARTLRTVLTTSEVVVILSGDGKTIYRIATRDIEVQESPSVSAP